MDFSHFNHLKSALLLFAIAHSSLNLIAIGSAYPQISSNNVLWVLSKFGEGQAEACFRHNLAPTEKTIAISWNEQTIKNILNLPQFSGYYTPLNGTRDPFLRECCASGLWCSTGNKSCFTQSYGDFFDNYGSISSSSINKDFLPVYSCTGNISIADMTVHIESVSHDSGVFSFYGDNFGISKENLTASVAGESCDKLDVCDGACMDCSGDICPVNSECLVVGSSAKCFKFCAGNQDKSCPCNTFCELVTISSSYTAVEVHICTPKSFHQEVESVCNNYAGESFECKSSRASQQSINQFTKNVSVAKLGNAGIASLKTIPVSPWCIEHSECNDGNICTEDSCIEGFCEYTSLLGCDSTSKSVRERQSIYAYRSYLQTGMSQVQLSFDEYLSNNGIASLVSSRDDYPMELLKLPFSFAFFGEKSSAISINPNGILSLPPIPSCRSYFTSSLCVLFSTGTNAISLWARDWDLSISGDAYYYFQLASTGNAVYNTIADAVHVSFQDVAKYASGQARKNPRTFNSFSASIYKDGSIRIRYHRVEDAVMSEDVFGLWGTIASNKDGSSTRYHSESVEKKLIVPGNDIVYCPIADSTVCLKDACVMQGKNLTMNWSAPSCVALNSNISYECVWAGGLATSIAVLTIDETTNSPLLSCVIPYLNVDDDSLVTVDVNIVLPLGTSNIDTLTKPGSYKGSILSVTRPPLSSSHSSSLSWSQVMVRYHSNTSLTTAANCGCSALPAYQGMLTCDVCNVCGGGSNTYDCAKVCFGTAYIDSCGNCAGGQTGKSPDSSCDPSSNEFNSNESESSSSFITDTYFLVLVLFGFGLVSTFIWTVRAQLYRRQFDQMAMLNETNGTAAAAPNRGLSDNELNQLKSFVFMSANDLEEGVDATVDCAICLMEFASGENCKRIPVPCGHIFHSKCIDEWLHNSITCPLCKRSLRQILSPPISIDGGNTASNSQNTAAAMITLSSPSLSTFQTVIPLINALRPPNATTLPNSIVLYDSSSISSQREVGLIAEFEMSPSESRSYAHQQPRSRADMSIMSVSSSPFINASEPEIIYEHNRLQSIDDSASNTQLHTNQHFPANDSSLFSDQEHLFADYNVDNHINNSNSLIYNNDNYNYDPNNNANNEDDNSNNNNNN